MLWLNNNIKWIMLIAGVGTCTMLYAALAPQAALTGMFGHGLQSEGAAAEVVVRNWAALITLVGVLLIYGAFNPLHRPIILALACASKAIFVGLALAFAREDIGQQLGVAIIFDALLIIVFAAWLVTHRSQPPAQ